MDGELDPDEAGHVLRDMKQDAGLRDAWTAYHLIGDSLRGNAALSVDISSGLARRLADEPTVLAPRSRSPQRKPFPLLGMAASISAFGFVGLLAWQVVKVNSTSVTPLVAAAPAAPAATQAPPVQLAAAQPPRKESVPAKVPAKASAADNSYLLAHQEFSPSYAVAGMSAYVRTVSGSEQDGGQ
jgi:sigma-E factor negative regulatory protein RseA